MKKKVFILVSFLFLVLILNSLDATLVNSFKVGKNFSTVDFLQYDSNNDLLYIGLQTFRKSDLNLWVYSPKENSLKDLSKTAINNWTGNSVITSLLYDLSSDLVYTGMNEEKFGVYNRSSDSWIDLRETRSGEWPKKFLVTSLEIDKENNLLYTGIYVLDYFKDEIGRYNPSKNELLGAYNPSTNEWKIIADLRLNNSGDYESKGVRSLAYDSENKIMYYQLGWSDIGEYNLSSGETKYLGNAEGSVGDGNMVYNSKNHRIYSPGSRDKFKVYDISLNKWEGLINKSHPLKWMGSNYISSLYYDDYKELIFTGLSGTLLGVYNRSEDIWKEIPLEEKDLFDTIADIAYDEKNNLIYLGRGMEGRVEVYNLSEINTGKTNNQDNTNDQNKKTQQDSFFKNLVKIFKRIFS